ncbi:mannonate dehydratase [Azorhizobium caulinodans ORS 571]|uniref:Mannonate dehydratase n=1 Tax=Azorhizobium caulinodans (strain ATCC 43989 / DSM 5975 / JCM 20966 / LMG 6465 / NBRC 14845 / NCIMB 13405 / ORS 571) TaxID=438753 RepID=A8I9B6_AZOC5|nr:mannonate dehydratase [Azorhizobium caulinodans]BAF88766.1 mannonate dehydratase [Azorhizobium caulinodans ORS 571]
MRQTWRWFGPKDIVPLSAVRQAGAQGIVTALHHVPTGSDWTLEEIRKRQDLVSGAGSAPTGLSWDVVESLPVSEDIKRQTGAWREHIASYKRSMAALAQAGIQTICYNFMPVLDWTRTDLRYRVAHGGEAMRFDLVDFAAFDLFVLTRPAAQEDYGPAIKEAAAARHAAMSEDDRKQLAANLTAGLPGAADGWSLDGVREQLALYDHISPDRLRQHLVDFLSEVVPEAEKLGLRLCCHPDDPPFPLLGLPRIVSTEADYRFMLDAVDSPANGVTLCSGSLGVRPDNDLPGMAERLGPRIHFVHLRNIRRQEPVDGLRRSFFEDEHLAGETDMVATIAALQTEEARRRAEGRTDWEIPMRPDHGQDILDDIGRGGQPGYPAIGRLKGLAELRGIMTALAHPLHLERA